MKVSCPHCRTIYEIDMSLIPEDGRDVQCANCQTVWYLSQSEPLLLMDVVKTPEGSDASSDSRIRSKPVLAFENQEIVPANQTARLEDRLNALEDFLAPAEKAPQENADIEEVVALEERPVEKSLDKPAESEKGETSEISNDEPATQSESNETEFGSYVKQHQEILASHPEVLGMVAADANGVFEKEADNAFTNIDDELRVDDFVAGAEIVTSKVIDAEFGEYSRDNDSEKAVGDDGSNVALDSNRQYDADGSKSDLAASNKNATDQTTLKESEAQEAQSDDEIFVAHAVERMSSRIKLSDQNLDKQVEVAVENFDGGVAPDDRDAPPFQKDYESLDAQADSVTMNKVSYEDLEEVSENEVYFGTEPANKVELKEATLASLTANGLEREFKEDENIRDSYKFSNDMAEVEENLQFPTADEDEIGEVDDKKQPQILPRQDDDQNSKDASKAKVKRSKRIANTHDAIESEAETQRSKAAPKLTKHQAELIENDPATKKGEDVDDAPPQRKMQFASSFWTGFLFVVTLLVVFASLRYLAEPISEVLPFSAQALSDYSSAIDKGMETVAQIFT